MNSFNPMLHGLRGIAAIGVLLFHWVSLFPELASSVSNLSALGTTWNLSALIGVGWLGVPLFFVLSGYLLGSQLAHRELSLPVVARFWKRRFYRIYPAVWVQLAILIALLPIPPPSIADLFRNLALWVNLPPWMTPPINGVWWTLPVELGFYLLLPLLILIERKIGWVPLLIGSMALTLTWRCGSILVIDREDNASLLTVLDALPGTLFTFVAGLSLAFIPWQPTLRQRRLSLLLVILIFFALLHWLRISADNYWKDHWILVIWHPLMALVIATGVYLLLTPPPEFNVLTSKPFVWLGEVSFGIYLWHFPVLQNLLVHWPDAWNTVPMSALALLLILAITLPIAALSFYLIERPIMGWGKHPNPHDSLPS